MTKSSKKDSKIYEGGGSDVLARMSTSIKQAAGFEIDEADLKLNNAEDVIKYYDDLKLPKPI